MKLDCEVIRDLVPLYCEDIASEKSRELVEEHCKECLECSRKMQRMRENEIIIEDNGSNLKEFMQKMKNNRNAIIALYCYIVAVVVSIIHGMFFDAPDVPIVMILYNLMIMPIVSLGCSIAIASHKLWIKYLVPIVCGFYTMIYQMILYQRPFHIEPVLFMFGFIPSIIGVVIGHTRLKKNDFGRFNEGMIVGIGIGILGVVLLAGNPFFTLIFLAVGALIYFISWVTRVR